MLHAIAPSPPLNAGFTRLGETRAQHWRPALAGALHSEIFAPAGEASGAAAAVALALDDLRARGRDPFADREDRRAVLWVQDRASIRRNGRPYRPGLPQELRERVIHVAAETTEEALFALEEGLRCRDLAFAIGEIVGNPQGFNFTASRRLSLAAERHGVPLWLVRHDAVRDLSAARMRWAVRSTVSPSPLWNTHAPGTPGWHAVLFRARAYAEGEWILRDDAQQLSAVSARQAHPVGLAFAAGDRSLAAG